ncbi:MAG: peptide deformylase [Clostridia bacterium]|nr:peptide deformylase [Clostridia bacterium]
MAVLEIRKKGDECLTKKCHAVTVFDRRLKLLLRDMRDTLIDSNGVGLAAPQVGILRRIFLVNDDGDIRVYINPQILERKGEQHPVEGCLSVPNVFGKVVRPMYVKIAALDENGEPFEEEAEGLIAECFEHEYEHLDGHLFDEKVYEFVEPDAEDDE